MLKTIERFAMECSINKVWTSEALAYAVDESVQVYGGNGYSREFPAERAYRDARITRIYEGTNEINRLIIPTRLLKRSPQLFTSKGARQALGERAEAASGPLAAERSALAEVNRLAIGLLGEAVAAYGEGFKDEQEVMAHVANVFIEQYAVDSAVARAEKLAASGAGSAALAADLAGIYASDAADRVAHAGKQVVAALRGVGFDAPALAEAVQKIAARPSADTVTARRRVAAHVNSTGRYSL